MTRASRITAAIIGLTMLGITGCARAPQRPQAIDGIVSAVQHKPQENYTRVYFRNRKGNLYYFGSYGWSETLAKECQAGENITAAGYVGRSNRDGTPITGVERPQDVCPRN